MPTTLTLTLALMNVAFSNLFGIGGGSLVARLLGAYREDEAKSVSAFSVYGAAAIALTYSLILGLFLNPILYLFGASEATIGFARQYAILVIVIGSLPAILSASLAHLLRNVGFSRQASVGLSSGGVLNMVLDPLFMFVLLPPGFEVFGAALATLLSNVFACCYLLYAFCRAAKTTALSLRPTDARYISRENLKKLLGMKIPVWVRVPVIPDVNDTVEEITALREFFLQNGRPERIELLPYHRLGENKYPALGKNAVLFSVPDAEKMAKLRKILE